MNAVNPRPLHHNVYVIELHEDVRQVARFARANPNARLDKPCLYVGVTGRTPEDRFAKHKAGIQCCTLVKNFGVRLRPRFFERFNPMSYRDAAKMEIELARRLRKRGFAVWQN